MNVIEVSNVSKGFKEQEVLTGCSLAVKQGEIYGLLGANGAGKTTLMKIICGFQQPDQGTARVCKKDSWEEREDIQGMIGSLIEAPVFYEHLSAKENLQIHLGYMGCDGDIEKTLELVGLGGVRNKPVGRFSMGMKQRLGIARAMLHSPNLFLLDEPVNGLDPMGIQEIRQTLEQLARQGKTILISSHILSEMEQLAHRVGILAGGKIAEEFSVDDKKKLHGEKFEDYVIGIMRRGER